MAEKNKGGRPNRVIDWKECIYLCKIHCTMEEIYAFFETDDKTLEAACQLTHKMSFPEFYNEKRQFGKMSLRRAQFKNALENNNVQMQIWLGKQKGWLGQEESKQTVELPKDITFKLAYSLDDEEDKNVGSDTNADEVQS